MTTDIQRALHPPDKQDVADRLTLELRRLAYDATVVSRGPELVSTARVGGGVALKFSNSSLVVRAGILVGTEAACTASAGNNTMVTARGTTQSLAYTIDGDTVTVQCRAVEAVHINPDSATCFLYGPEWMPPRPCSSTARSEGSCGGKEARLVG